MRSAADAVSLAADLREHVQREAPEEQREPVDVTNSVGEEREVQRRQSDGGPEGGGPIRADEARG